MFPSPCGVCDLKRHTLLPLVGRGPRFPSPCGVCDLKLQLDLIHFLRFHRRFPSPCGVCDLKLFCPKNVRRQLHRFPSPCGVCDLKLYHSIDSQQLDYMFPSPCGVCDLKPLSCPPRFHAGSRWRLRRGFVFCPFPASPGCENALQALPLLARRGFLSQYSTKAADAQESLPSRYVSRCSRGKTAALNALPFPPRKILHESRADAAHCLFLM